MKKLLFILFSLIPFISYGQATNKFGPVRATDTGIAVGSIRVDSVLQAATIKVKDHIAFSHKDSIAVSAIGGANSDTAKYARLTDSTIFQTKSLANNIFLRIDDSTGSIASPIYYTTPFFTNTTYLKKTDTGTLVSTLTMLKDTAAALRALTPSAPTLQSVLTTGNTATNIPIISNNNFVSDSSNNGELYNHYSGTFGDSVITQTDSIWVFGDSYESPATCATSTSLGWVQLLSGWIGATLINYAIPGTTLHRATVGDSSMVDRIYLIPVKRPGLRALFITYGLNDANGGTDSSVIRSSLTQVLDTAIARGWPAASVIVTSPAPVRTLLTRINTYVYVDSVVCKALGVTYINTTASLSATGWVNVACSDSFHINNVGHHAYGQAVYRAFPVFKAPQLVINATTSVNGTMNVNKLFNVNIPTFNTGITHYKLPTYNSIGQKNRIDFYPSTSQPGDTAAIQLTAEANNRVSLSICNNNFQTLHFGFDTTITAGGNFFMTGTYNSILSPFVNANTIPLVIYQSLTSSAGQNVKVLFAPKSTGTDSGYIQYSVLAGNHHSLGMGFYNSANPAFLLYPSTINANGDSMTTQVLNVRNNFYAINQANSGTLAVAGTTNLNGLINLNNSIIADNNGSTPTLQINNTGTGLTMQVKGSNTAELINLINQVSNGSSSIKYSNSGGAWQASIGYTNTSYGTEPGTMLFYSNQSVPWIWNNQGGRIMSLSAAGGLALPSATVTGTATTAKPMVLVEPTGTTSTNWNTSGTYFGANAPSAFTGNLIDLQYNGASNFSVGNNQTIAKSLLVSTDITLARHLIGTGSTPVLTAGSGMGTSPTGLSVSGDDMGGTLTFTTGSTPTAGATVGTLTFNVAFGSAVRGVVLVPANDAAISLATANVVYAPSSGYGTTSFTINQSAASIIGLSASTQYKYVYIVKP